MCVVVWNWESATRISGIQRKPLFCSVYHIQPLFLYLINRNSLRVTWVCITTKRSPECFTWRLYSELRASLLHDPQFGDWFHPMLHCRKRFLDLWQAKEEFVISQCLHMYTSNPVRLFVVHGYWTCRSPAKRALLENKFLLWRCMSLLLLWLLLLFRIGKASSTICLWRKRIGCSALKNEFVYTKCSNYNLYLNRLSVLLYLEINLFSANTFCGDNVNLWSCRQEICVDMCMHAWVHSEDIVSLHHWSHLFVHC